MNSTSLPSDFCPYKGLEPYTAEHRDFFFGRERDQKTIISNLYATPLTILYGASGVGKSSVLMAGVVPHLRETLKLPIVVFRNWQGENFAQALKENVLAEVSEKISPGELARIKSEAPFDIFLAQCIDAARSPIFFILDQFEEYFLYHPPSTEESSFDAQFARAVNRRDVEAKFLLSMREEGLSKLDRFRGRIPNMLGNTLRLNHLDRQAAIRAICEPLCVYNERVAAQRRVKIETWLLGAVLRRSRQRPSLDGGQGQAAKKLRRDWPIETPILQMLITRLWDEECRLWEQESASLPPAQAAGYERRMRYSTLKNKLKGAENVLLTYLDKALGDLDESERDAAMKVFQFLVTPDETKIAQAPNTLAEWTGLNIERVRSLLKKLSSQELHQIRILRNVPLPGQRERYEITHDVLAKPILHWSQEQANKQKEGRIRQEEEARRELERAEAAQRRQQERARWMRRSLIILSALLLLTTAVAVFAFRQRAEAESARRFAESRRQEAEVAKNALEAANQEVQIARNVAVEEAERARENEKQAVEARDKEAAARKLAETQTKRANEQARIATAARQKAEQAAARIEAQARIDQLYRRGTDLYLKGDYNGAIEAFTQTLYLYRRSNDSTGEAGTLLNIATVYNSLGEQAKALEYYVRALALFRATGNLASEARVFNSIGELFTSRGDVEQALDYLQRARELYDDVDDAGGEARILNSLGKLYGKRGDISRARAYLERALALYRETKNRAGEADTLISIGEFYETMTEDQKSLEYYMKAAQIYREVQNPINESRALNKIGSVYASQGDLENALEYYRRASETLPGAP